MVEKDVIIKNRAGLHTRPAAALVKLAAQFKCEFFIYKDGFEIIWKIMKKNNGNKPMGLEAYQKAIGCATVDELITAATNYAELKKDVEKKYFMHVSSFLNTKYKKWEQYLTVEQETPKEESNERTAEFGK